MSLEYDAIVIGGGAAGTHAAFPLVEAGLDVCLIDGGIGPAEQFDISEDQDFEDIRRNRFDQHEIFFGKKSGSLKMPSGLAHVGSMASGRFSYISERTESFLPTQTGNFQLAQTLAKGGLTEVWGGASDVLDDAEIEAIGLPISLKEHYQIIIDRIGLSGPIDGYRTQPSAILGAHAQKILSKYHAQKAFFEKQGISLRESCLALLTEGLGQRKKTSYSDTDYWLNGRKSLYRAKYTLEELQQKKNFHYAGCRVVSDIIESASGVSVNAVDFSRQRHIYAARYVIVAAGALNTLRILLKSKKLYGIKVPIISKPHVVTPLLDVGFLGKTDDKKQHSLCQLVLEDTNKISGFSSSYTQLYGYKSLLLYKLLDFMPLTKPESLSLLSMFVPAMMIADSRFPTQIGRGSNCCLKHLQGKDILEIEYPNNSEEKVATRNRLKTIKKALRKIGLIPLKNVFMPEGSSAHYAGGIGGSGDRHFALRADENGMLCGSSRVFTADSSLWKALPSKPPTLTIMANANRIGRNLASLFKNDGKKNRDFSWYH